MLNLVSSDVIRVVKMGFTIIDLFQFQLKMLLGASYVWILLGEFMG